VINGSVILELQRATHLTMHALALQLGKLDLSPSEINALANLADGHSRTVSALGAAVGTRPATLTGILDRLERRGLVARATKPRDRRAVLIELTPAGRRSARIIVTAIDDLERRALDALPDDAIHGAHAVLRALTEAGS
jgi:MarR family transcriptional regulator, organic hydroperoxide resistance regulator